MDTDEELFGKEIDDEMDQISTPTKEEEASMNSESSLEEYTRSATLPELPGPSVKGELFLAKLPNFLDVDPRPFESASYRPEDDEDEEQVRLRIENTVRWRYIRDAQGNLKGRESNSRVIRWSDGTLSLLLGDELFEIVVQSMDNDYQYLVAHHTEEGLFQTQAQFKRLMTFRPQGTHSMTHKKLTMAIATKHKKEQRLKMFASREDPEKLKQEAERLENEKLKARRRLEAKQRSAAAKYGLNEDFLEEEEEEMRYRQGDAALTKALDEYEQDDFVVNDDDAIEEYTENDDSEEEREARILNAKQEVYSEDSEEEMPSRNKRRAVFDSDDE